MTITTSTDLNRLSLSHSELIELKVDTLLVLTRLDMTRVMSFKDLLRNRTHQRDRAVLKCIIWLP